MFGNLAELQNDNTYLTLLGRQPVKIHPTSVFCDKEKPKYIVFSELIATGRTYVRTVSAIEQEWAEEVMLKMKNVTTSSYTTHRRGILDINSVLDRAGTSSSSNSNSIFPNNSHKNDSYS